jgi:S1-C subfamily serine protease
VICPVCRASNQTQAKVCLSCGNSLTGSSTGRPIIGMDGTVIPAASSTINKASIPLRIQSWRNPKVVAGVIFGAIALLAVLVGIGSDSTQVEEETAETVVPADQPDQSEALEIGSEIVSGVNVQLSIVQVVVQDSGKDCYAGSGSVVIDQWHVLTSFHVVESDSKCDVDQIFIETIQRIDSAPIRTHRAEVVAVDENADLAILRITAIDGQVSKLVPVEIADEAKLGEELIAVGFPAIGGDSVTVTKGEISGFSNYLGVRWIKSSISISAGNSGGGAFNSTGQLVGVPTSLGVPGIEETTDCRPDRDTNGDGELDDDDECVSMGGFINTLSPGSSAIQLAKSEGLLP